MISGAVLCVAYLLAWADRAIGSTADIDALSAQLAAPDQTLWAPSRVAQYERAMRESPELPVAILRVADVDLEVPVYPHATDLALNRGAALVPGMGLPDHGGNVGIAGHRDGFFRALKDIQNGQVIELRTRAKLHRYRVTSLRVVDIHDTRLLADTDEPSVTLITCYPFYYVGPAPKRFVVSATYDWTPAESR